jgi:hypothetical protein
VRARAPVTDEANMPHTPVRYAQMKRKNAGNTRPETILAAFCGYSRRSTKRPCEIVAQVLLSTRRARCD